MISGTPNHNNYQTPVQMFTALDSWLFLAVGIESIVIYHLATRPEQLRRKLVRLGCRL